MTKNFSLAELTFSQTALSRGIDNTPSPEIEENLRILAEDILQPIRDAIDCPIIVSSGYRSEQLNKAIKGAKTSQHLTGAAADIYIHPKPNETRKDANRRLFNLIADMIRSGEITVGQLIDEYNYSWIHVSLPHIRHHNDIRHLS